MIRAWLANFDNLELAGRNGMHKYNNQDHSMMTALLAARNILGHGPFDPWKVNTDAEYHEEGLAARPRDAAAPYPVASPRPDPPLFRHEPRLPRESILTSRATARRRSRSGLECRLAIILAAEARQLLFVSPVADESDHSVQSSMYRTYPLTRGLPSRTGRMP